MGFRDLEGIYDPETKTLGIGGYIDVKKTGVGLGKAIDTTTIKNLQSVSDAYGIKIRWNVLNNNLMKLQNLEKDLNDDPLNKKIIAELLQKKAEQAAWEKLYGLGGYFEFEEAYSDEASGYKEYRKFLTPIGAPHSMGKDFDALFSGEAQGPSPEAEKYIKNLRETLEEE